MIDQDNHSDLLMYRSENGEIRIDVKLEDETVWLSQNQMATLFGKSKSTISEHIKNVFEEGELDEKVVVRYFRTTTPHGALPDKEQSRDVRYYNLDVVISVGYRVKSVQGTRFRIWATTRLREYLIKGFTLDDQRLASGASYNYFRELLERIREIRLSEKVFYQQIQDIYALSIDYDPSDDMTKLFFREIQNKLLFAVSKQTAAELIYFRANADLPLMGLTHTRTKDKVRKGDIGIGKNYLSEDEIRALKSIVEQFLAYAEGQAHAQKPMYMKDWIEKLRIILTMNEKTILEHKGKISRALAMEKATKEYDKYREKLRIAEHTASIRQLSSDLRQIKNKGIASPDHDDNENGA